MGTRNLTIVFYQGKYQVAQYCQWDGYPAGQGADILDFLVTPGNIDRLKVGLAHTRICSEAEIKDKWLRCGADESGWVNRAISDKFKEIFPSLHRDCGSEILEIIASSNGVDVPLGFAIEFAADGLFCEWAYVVDLDAGNLEVFKGFVKAPRDPNERFDFLADKREGEYSYVRLAKVWPLAELPTKEDFLAALEPVEEMEAAE